MEEEGRRLTQEREDALLLIKTLKGEKRAGGRRLEESLLSVA